MGGALRSSEDGLKPEWIKGEIIFARVFNGLRVYLADRKAPQIEVTPPSPRKYWTRRGIAEWLAERLVEAVPTIVGIDYSFSFPQQAAALYLHQGQQAF